MDKDTLNTYSVKQLKNIISKHNSLEKINIIKAYAKMKKSELVEAISQQIKQERLMTIVKSLKLTDVGKVDELFGMIEEGGSKVAKKIKDTSTKVRMRGTYPELIDAKISKLKDFIEKVKEEVKKAKDIIQNTVPRMQRREVKTKKIRDKLTAQLQKIADIGKDKSGNTYLPEMYKYFGAKYGDKWFELHPTAYKDKYWKKDDEQYDLNKEAEKAIKDVN